MFARFDKNPAMTLQDIKNTKCYGQTDAQLENSIPTTNKVCGYPPQTKFAGGININKLNALVIAKFKYLTFDPLGLFDQTYRISRVHGTYHLYQE